MADYQKECIVTKEDLDDLNHVNNVRYVQWIQDISKEHWQHKAPKDIQEEVIWVVMTHFIEYKAAAILNDPITITTFIKNSNGAKCTRVVEMVHSKTKALIVRSSTEWCLLSKTSLKPKRISEEIKNIFLESD